MGPYLETAPGGEKWGINPVFLESGHLEALGGPQSPIAAIRAMCVDCSGGSQSEARKCTAILCPLWPFRMGTNVFHARSRRKRGKTGPGTDEA
jgi:hypothetical protein